MSKVYKGVWEGVYSVLDRGEGDQGPASLPPGRQSHRKLQKQLIIYSPCYSKCLPTVGVVKWGGGFNLIILHLRTHASGLECRENILSECWWNSLESFPCLCLDDKSRLGSSRNLPGFLPVQITWYWGTVREDGSASLTSSFVVMNILRPRSPLLKATKPAKLAISIWLAQVWVWDCGTSPRIGVVKQTLWENSKIVWFVWQLKLNWNFIF